MARKAATGVNSMPSTVQVPQAPVERRVLREDWVVALDLKPQTLTRLEGNATWPDGDSQLNHSTRRDFLFLIMREKQLRWLAIAPAVLGNISINPNMRSGKRLNLYSGRHVAMRL